MTLLKEVFCVTGFIITVGPGVTFSGVTLGPIEGTVFDLAQGWSMYKSTNGYAWTLTNINCQPTRITAIEPSANYANDKTVYVAVDTSRDSFTTIYRCTNGAAVGTPYTEMAKISAGEHGTTPASVVYYIDSYFDAPMSGCWLRPISMSSPFPMTAA